MRRMLKSTAAAAALSLLAGCQTTPSTKVSQSAKPAPVSHDLPYRWTQGVAPQAYKDMVATFGRTGLKPGEYLWASSIPKDGDPHIVIDLLTQMAYVYRGDTLV